LLSAPGTRHSSALRSIFRALVFIAGSEDIFEGAPDFPMFCSISTVSIAASPVLFLPVSAALARVEAATILFGIGATCPGAVLRALGKCVLVLRHLLVHEEIQPALNDIRQGRLWRVHCTRHNTCVTYSRLISGAVGDSGIWNGFIAHWCIHLARRVAGIVLFIGVATERLLDEAGALGGLFRCASA